MHIFKSMQYSYFKPFERYVLFLILWTIFLVSTFYDLLLMILFTLCQVLSHELFLNSNTPPFKNMYVIIY